MNKKFEFVSLSLEYQTDLLCEALERDKQDDEMIMGFVEKVRELLKKVVKEVKQ